MRAIREALPLSANEGIAAVFKLIRIATRILATSGDRIDQRILQLHFRERLKFSQIAQLIGVTEDCAKRRWARLIWRVTNSVSDQIQQDQKLKLIFSAIMQNRTMFRRAILGILEIVEAKGLSAIADTIRVILPE